MNDNTAMRVDTYDLSAHPLTVGVVDFEERDGYGDAAADHVDTSGEQKPNVVTSLIADGPYAGQHVVAVDLDVPARLVPSSTPGHSHLYIDTPMPWRDYQRLLDALAMAGVIEAGYAAASQARGYTALRLPWIKKETPADE